MAKKKVRIPKQVLGLKIPKSIRKSSIINNALASKAGREMAAAALTAAATAAAGVLISERKEIADTAKKTANKASKGSNIVAEAMERAFEAGMEELGMSRRKEEKKEASRRSYEGAPVH